MQSPLRLLARRTFAPLFATQFLNAFNDNFYKMAMVLLATFTIYSDPASEAAFANLAGGLFILPFVLFSAIAGQIADSIDKARAIRAIKTAEIVIMIVGAIGIQLASPPIMLAALFAMGTQSAFFGPIKYSILPQHLPSEDVLGGTGLVEAGTYLGILTGTILGGLVSPGVAAFGVVGFALIGRLTAAQVPDAPPAQNAAALRIDWNIVRGGWQVVAHAMRQRAQRLAIVAISFFWAIGAVLIAIFPPLVKNAIGGDEGVATLFTAAFSIGIALGSVAINRLLGGRISARFTLIAAAAMILLLVDLRWVIETWPAPSGALIGWRAYLGEPGGVRFFLDLLGIAAAGGMFVVPLYAFLTTSVGEAQSSRTIAALNIVNSLFMVAAALVYAALVGAGVAVADTLYFVIGLAACAAFSGWRLYRAAG